MPFLLSNNNMFLERQAARNGTQKFVKTNSFTRLVAVTKSGGSTLALATIMFQDGQIARIARKMSL